MHRTRKFDQAEYQREAILAAMSFSQADAPCLETPGIGCFGNPFTPSIFSSTDFILEKGAAGLCSDSTKVEQARTDRAVGQPVEHGESDSVLLTDSPALFDTDTLSQKAGQQDRVTITDEPGHFSNAKSLQGEARAGDAQPVSCSAPGHFCFGEALCESQAKHCSAQFPLQNKALGRACHPLHGAWS